MIVKFVVNNAATPLLKYEMTEAPQVGSFISLVDTDDESVLYKVAAVQHVFKATGRGGRYDYDVKVDVFPI